VLDLLLISVAFAHASPAVADLVCCFWFAHEHNSLRLGHGGHHALTLARNALSVLTIAAHFAVIMADTKNPHDGGVVITALSTSSSRALAGHTPGSAP